MRTLLALAVLILQCDLLAHGQSTPVTEVATESLRLSEANLAHDLALQIRIDDLPYDDYWTKTVDDIFTFADTNSDGLLNEQEIRFVPSARSIRLSLGTGFTPPVSPIQSLKEIASFDSQTCSKDDLRSYYRRHGAGRPVISYGRLPLTVALTKAILQAVDQDRDGKLSQEELAKAEATLRRLDANDDELISVGELVPGGTYPGNWATTPLAADHAVDVSLTGNRSLTLAKIPQLIGSGPAPSSTESTSTASQIAPWQITISDQLHDVPVKLTTRLRCESWSVPGPLLTLHDEFREALATADPSPAADAETTTQQRNRRPNRGWLTPWVDRDHNQEASPQEIEQWLTLQRKIMHGQLLISVYYGGGLLELLDTNHDAGLSVRELRTAWQNLESASCVSDGLVDPQQVPNVLMLIASQGYPTSFTRTPTVAEPEWFPKMDRNADGDVSHREFTGSLEAFNNLDQDHDGLISLSEAQSQTR